MTRSGPLLGATEEMDMGMDETQMILALRALRELLDNGDRDDGDELVASYRTLGKAIVKNKPMTRKDRTRVAKYLREAGWGRRDWCGHGASRCPCGSSRVRIDGPPSRRGHD
jgi:hypothetical protein